MFEKVFFQIKKKKKKKEACQNYDKWWIENMEFGKCLFYIINIVNMYILVTHHMRA